MLPSHRVRCSIDHASAVSEKYRTSIECERVDTERIVLQRMSHPATLHAARVGHVTVRRGSLKMAARRHDPVGDRKVGSPSLIQTRCSSFISPCELYYGFEYGSSR